jgi:hypothetical protein
VEFLLYPALNAPGYCQSSLRDENLLSSSASPVRNLFQTGAFQACFPWLDQKVNLAPNWNWRGVLMVFMIVPKLAGLDGIGSPEAIACCIALYTSALLGTVGYPYCGVLVML